MLDDWISALDAWVRLNAAWAAPVTFLIAFLESFPVVSIVVPSTALLLGIGAMLGAGMIDPLPVLLGCVLGGILGDAAGYWLARAVGPARVRRWLPNACRRVYAWSVVVFRRWGWWAVFLGRFIGPMRAVTPLAAGITGMRNWPFQTANILSALVWAPLMLMPGSLGGWLARQIGPDPSPLTLAALAGAALLAWFGWQRLRAPLAGALAAWLPRR